MKPCKCSIWFGAILLLLPAAGWAAAGILDPTFGNGGVASGASTFGEVTGLVRQPDGKLVGAGITTDASRTTYSTFGRYNADGTLDTTFGDGGLVSTPVFAMALALQPDGKLVAAGRLLNPPADPGDPYGTHFAVVRCNPDGSVDTTFGNGGVATTTFRAIDELQALALQPDGKVLVLGRTEYQVLVYGVPGWQSSVALARFNTDGSLDQSFGSHGQVITTIAENTDTSGIAIRSDGTILVGATSENDDGATDFHFVLIRYLAGGQLDSRFGVGGVLQSIAGSMGAMRLLPDGKVIAAGQRSGGGEFALVRINEDGSDDFSFGNQGVTLPIGIPGAPQALMDRSDGSVLAAGFSRGRALLVQFTAAGTLDPYFARGGVALTDGFKGVRAIAVQPDNTMVVGGTPWTLARYLDGVCGNGVLEAGEECDDGNLTNGDGCDANCTLSRCGNGVKGPDEACDDGNQNNFDDCKNDCTLNVCGDGVVHTGVEACDDGTAVDDDGCSNGCLRTACGDGVVQPSEECDDGNTVSGDGCDANCFIEQCGNGRVEANEQCDDGAGADDGRCRADCRWSLAYDAVLDPVRSMGLSLQPDQDEATYSQMFFVHSAKTSIFDPGVPPPDFHTNQLVIDEGDCPAGTIVSGSPPPTFTSGSRGWAQVTVHATRGAFPHATQDTPQWCTLHFTVRTVPEDVWDQTPQNNSITVPFGVWAAGVTDEPTSFMLQSVKPQHVKIARHRAAVRRHVRVKLSIGRPDPKRTIAVTMQDGTCPAGTVDGTAAVAVALRRRHTAVSVPLTLTAGAFWTPTRGSPARCTPVITAVDTAADAGPHVTQFDVDVTDGNDL